MTQLSSYLSLYSGPALGLFGGGVHKRLLFFNYVPLIPQYSSSKNNTFFGCMECHCAGITENKEQFLKKKMSWDAMLSFQTMKVS